MPMLIGEWGAFGNWDKRILPSARVIQRIFEELLCGDTYWNFGPGIDKQAYFPVLRRSIPCRIAGVLKEYRCDPKAGTFRCTWEEKSNIDASTIVFVTKDSFAEHPIRLEPAGSGYEVRYADDKSGNVYLLIQPTGRGVVRCLTTD